MSKKNTEQDDDFTVVNMNVDGMKGHVDDEQWRKITEIRQLNLTKAERRAIFWGSFKAMIPTMFFIIFGFGLAALFCWWWLG